MDCIEGRYAEVRVKNQHFRTRFKILKINYIYPLFAIKFDKVAFGMLVI